jgi:hypothetical protein
MISVLHPKKQSNLNQVDIQLASFVKKGPKDNICSQNATILLSQKFLLKTTRRKPAHYAELFNIENKDRVLDLIYLPTQHKI